MWKRVQMKRMCLIHFRGNLNQNYAMFNMYTLINIDSISFILCYAYVMMTSYYLFIRELYNLQFELYLF